MNNLVTHFLYLLMFYGGSGGGGGGVCTRMCVCVWVGPRLLLEVPHQISTAKT